MWYFYLTPNNRQNHPKTESKFRSRPWRSAPIFYHSTEVSISYPLSILYRSIIELHTLPTEWKCAIITPIFKKGSPSDPANYRPIALTCTCCKILECIISNEFINFLNSHKLITIQQHGFLKKHSTVTNLLESVNDWTFALSNRKSVVIAYIDFQKAFDSVSHPKLIHKLISYGVPWQPPPLDNFLSVWQVSICPRRILSFQNLALWVAVYLKVA